jgi:NAD+ synthase (glutamine-hydrolysing)
MKIALAQINPKAGDLNGNAAKILGIIQSHSLLADLIIFPELALFGYPPKDLLLRPELLAEGQRILQEEIMPSTGAASVLLGTVTESPIGGRLYNSLVLIEDKKLRRVFHKELLPNYEVFNESRYFEAGFSGQVSDLTVQIKGKKVAVFICEDLLGIEENFDFYPKGNPLTFLQSQDYEPDLMICASASPYRVGQAQKRIELARNAQKILKAPVVLVNQVGANDDLIFDGSSFALNKKGEVSELLPSFCEQIEVVDLDSKTVPVKQPLLGPDEIREALVLGIKDYFAKTGFKRAFIGISGGIDSALVAALAVQALGAENVSGILMPSAYSSQGSLDDGQELLQNLKVKAQVITIEPILQAYNSAAGFKALTLAEENLQSRIRGAILMGKANDQNGLVLATGNKSEFAVGYSTLYGDMCGAIAPIGDLWKTNVWELAKTFTQIPRQIIQKPPSAELRPNQLDTDSLPDYKTLDQILKAYIEGGMSDLQISELGFESDEVKRVLKLVTQNEFKRKQAPIILKVSKNAFGSGWQYPVVK